MLTFQSPHNQSSADTFLPKAKHDQQQLLPLMLQGTFLAADLIEASNIQHLRS